MFGYVTICEPELKVKDLKRYKAYYCGLCRELKEKYGFMGQMTLTYDMTFASFSSRRCMRAARLRKCTAAKCIR